jgi:hypothetical protein
VIVVVAVWVALPLLAMIFLVRLPGTHVMGAYEALTVLAGLGVAVLFDRVPGRLPRMAVSAMLLAGLACAAMYEYNTFIRTEPEVVRSRQAARFPLYWTNGVPVIDRHRFGLPYQAGWKAVGMLFADGALDGSYISNENEPITHWYTRGALRCSKDARYVILAENVRSEYRPARAMVPSDGRPTAVITIQGQPKIRVFDRLGPAPSTPAVYAQEALAARFEHELGPVGLLTYDASPTTGAFWAPVRDRLVGDASADGISNCT